MASHGQVSPAAPNGHQHEDGNVSFPHANVVGSTSNEPDSGSEGLVASSDGPESLHAGDQAHYKDGDANLAHGDHSPDTRSLLLSFDEHDDVPEDWSFTFTEVAKPLTNIHGTRRTLASVTAFNAKTDLESAEIRNADRKEATQDISLRSANKFQPSGPNTSRESFTRDLTQDASESLEAPEVQRQIDEQLYSEASTRGSDESDTNSEQSGDDVIMVDDAPEVLNNSPAEDMAPGHQGAPSSFPVQRITPRPSSNSATRITSQRSNAQVISAVRSPRVAADETLEQIPPDDTEDLLAVVRFKLQQKEKTIAAAFNSELEGLQLALQESENYREELQNRLAEYQEQCQGLTVTVETYQKQVVKVKTLQKFMNGLGNDLGSLKQMYDAHQGQVGELGKDVREQQLLQQKLVEQLDQSKTTLEKALEMKDFEIESVVAHRDSLRGQLEDRIGQLAEERDRSMALQQRIKNLEQGDMKALSEEITDCKTSVLQKLSNTAKKDDELMLGLGELQLAMRQLNDHPPASANDCAAITAAMQSLEANLLREREMRTNPADSSFDIVASLNSLQRDLSQGLQADLQDWRSHMEEHISHREDHAQLRTQLDCTSSRIRDLQTEINNAKEVEKGLKQTISTLNERIDELQSTSQAVAALPTTGISKPSKDEERKIREAVNTAKKQMSDSATVFNAQEQARFDNKLKRAVSERDVCSQQLQTQTEETNALRMKLEQFEASHAASLLEVENREQAARERVQLLETALQSTQVESIEAKEFRSKHEALLALKAIEDKVTLELRDNNAALTREIQESQAALLQTRASAKQNDELFQCVRTEQAVRLEELQTKLTRAADEIKSKEEGVSQLKTRCQNLVTDQQQRHQAQIDALQDHLSQTQGELAENAKEAEDFRRDTEVAYSHDLVTWKNKIGESERKAAESATARDQALRAAQDQQKRGDTLQAQLAEAERKIIETTSYKDEASRAADEQGKRNNSLQADLRAAERKAAECAISKDEAMQSAEAQRKRADAFLSQITALEVAEETRLHKERLTALRNKPAELESFSNAQVSTEQQTKSTVDNHPPHAGPTRTILTKPRKKADRNTNTIVDPFPGALPAKRRRVSETEQDRRATGGAQISNEPAIELEQSQIPVQQPMQPMHRTQPSEHSSSMPLPTSKSSDSEEMLDLAISASQHLPDTVPETQLDEALLTFASFTKNMASSYETQSQSTSSQIQAAPRIFDLDPMSASAARSHKSTRRSPAQNLVAKPTGSPEFQIFEDQEDDQPVQDHPRSLLNDEFTFKMPTAKPNSASKRQPRTKSDQTDRSKSRGNVDRSMTPDNFEYGSGMPSPPKPMPQKRGSGSSSTPPFVEKTKDKVYGSGNSFKARRRLSANSNNEVPTTDPRIAAKSAGRKRIAERESQMSYEPKSKRRVTPAGSTNLNLRRVSSNEGLLARQNQSVNDLPRTSDMIPRRLRDGGEGGPRMRTYAGGSSRASRSKTKKSKNDEYSARFSQELGGR